jgi:hypothetical protein
MKLSVVSKRIGQINSTTHSQIIYSNLVINMIRFHLNTSIETLKYRVVKYGKCSTIKKQTSSEKK